MQTDVMFSTLALAYILVMAMAAWTRGVLGAMKALFSWAAAVAAAIFMFKHGVGFYESSAGKQLPLWSTNVVSIVLAGVAFIVARIVGKWAFERVFGDEGPLFWMMKGPIGAALSLIPSCAMLLLISMMVRMTGSVYEVGQIAQITANQRPGSVSRLPDKPITTRWRDGVEVWPMSKWALDQLDPLTNVPQRNLAQLLMAAYEQPVRAEFRRRESTRTIIEHPNVVALLADEELRAIIKGESGSISPAGFLWNQKIREALKDRELRKQLSTLDMADEIESVLTGQEKPRNKSWLKKIFS